MSVLKRLLLGSCALALVLMFSPDAQVSEIDQKVIGTFSAPVMIPGQILPPGTYVFKVLNGWDTSDNVVRVWTADETRVLATAITIPRYRANPGDKQIFQFEERGPDSPQAIKAWFYPGFNYGHEFIYPKTIAAATVGSAVNNNAGPTPVASSSPAEESAAAVTPEPAPVAESTSSAEQDQTQQTSPAPAAEELPKTASSTPLIALVSMLLLGGALGLKAFASRWS